MLFYEDPMFLAHDTPAGHPERKERLLAVHDALDAAGLLDQLDRRRPPAASRKAIEHAHSAEHLDRLKQLSPATALLPLDPDTTLGPNSLAAAERAAGALLDAVEQVLTGQANRAFCATRPPGHHAERGNAMGFCLFNSVAIGALDALNRHEIGRVAILDFDVHHGNGTVDILRDEPRALVCSSFQHPHYPNRLHDVQGNHLVYSPLAAGSGSDTFRQTIERDWLPALAAHQPNLIFVSAGFDGHAADPLAQLELTVEDYRWITELIVDQASRFADGRVISTLEGGYELDALGASVTAHVEVLHA